MGSQQAIVSTDLSGVIVGETAISDVQGEAGRLSYRGIDIADLVAKPFAEVVWLVLLGEWPDARQLGELHRLMAVNSELSTRETGLLRHVSQELHPMLMLQGLLPLIPLPAKPSGELELAAEQGLVLAAKIASLIAAHYRMGLGEEPVSSSPDMGFHENFLHMFHGTAPSAEQVHFLDVAQILQMEHSFNAGTFAGRVCASTLAPIQSSISASLGTLFGRLHGGADEAALEMAIAIGDAAAAEAYVEETLAKNEKIMGMGHREYRTVDPRARILKPMAVELCQGEESKALLATLVAVEQACQRIFAAQGKEIWANVEFYKGAVFHSLGIPSNYFTAMFSMARVYGYIAHFLEFSRDSRLIRPRALYKQQDAA